MKTVHRKLVAALFAAAVVVSGCGGSDDDSAGGLTEFSASPDAITLTGPDDTTCAGPGMAGRVFIHGGAGPYRVENTFPTLLATTNVTYSDTQAYFEWIRESLTSSTKQAGSLR
jgi:hypothetical protein